MAQTSRPRPRVGLPSSPAPRSRSLSARVPSQDLPPRPSSAASQRSRTFTAITSTAPPVPQLPHKLRPQRSFADIPSAWNANTAPRQPEVKRIARIPPPPLPVEKSPVPDDDGNLTSEFGRKGSVSSLASSASTSSRASATSSSSSSSFFGTKSPLSAASSTTSLEDDAYVPKCDPPPIPSKPAPGFGTALWNRVAVVAENLTVSVSKAIETNIATYSGEVTPPGQESRLTRAMKQYHISKARDPSDLPEWLFEERDRGVIGRLKVTNATPGDDLSRSATPSMPPASTNVDRLSTSRPLPSPWENQPRQTDLVAPVPRLPQNLTVPSIPRSTPATPAPQSVQSATSSKSGAIPVPTRVGAPLSMLAAHLPSNARVRFAEQIHPRQSPLDGLGGNRAMSERGGSSAGTAPQTAGMTMVRGGSSTPVKGARLPSVDIRGRRPSARGLPSGVRPARV